MTATIEIHPLAGIKEVKPGSDLAAMLGEALEAAGLHNLRSGDILLVTQKVVSKAEGRFADLCDVTPGAKALQLAAVTQKDPRFVELVLSESSAVVRAAPQVLITRHRCGYVMANAGIDRSNVGGGPPDRVLLLPLDPDASAKRLRQDLRARLGGPLAIIISDSFGRPWRHGVVGVALGASGLPSLVDKRGELDRDGRSLEVTQVALADCVASAASLVTGEGAEGIPAALVRNLAWFSESSPATALIRPLAEDLFQ